MLPSKISLRPPSQMSLGQALFVENGLNYYSHPNANSIGDGPDVGLLVELDDFVWTSLEAQLPPFRSVESTRQDWVLETDVNGRNHRIRRQFRVVKALPNSGCPASEKVAGLFSMIMRGATILAPLAPEACQLVCAPHIQLLRDVFIGHRISGYIDCGRDIRVDEKNHTVADIYNNFVACFLRALRAKKWLRCERHNWGWGSEENIKSLHAYLDDLFDRHASLSVLHLRFFAGPPAKLISAQVTDPHRHLEHLRECRKKFFDRMRRKRSLFTDHPGYVWSYLPSLDGGYSLHLTLLFDTASLRKVVDDLDVEAKEADEVLQRHADQIGAYWVTVGTGGRGSYLRADQNGWFYGPDWVHGEVQADDLVRRDNLKKTLGYLALRRALVRLTNEPRGEYFGMREHRGRAPRRSREAGPNSRHSPETLAEFPEIDIQNA